VVSFRSGGRLKRRIECLRLDLTGSGGRGQGGRVFDEHQACFFVMTCGAAQDVVLKPGHEHCLVAHGPHQTHLLTA
jgi:hypothetical protein